VAEECADCAQLDTDHKVALAGTRVWRMVLARLEDDDDSIDTLFDETGGCPDCLGGMARYLASAFAGFAESQGGKELSIQITEKELAKPIDNLRR
jgi:hypothetical protein